MALSGKFAGLALSVDQPARMTIIHPVTRQVLRLVTSADGEPWPTDDNECYIDLLSESSAKGRAQDRAVNDRLLRTRGARYTSDQAYADLTEKYAQLSVGWRLCALDGTPLEIDCTLVNARELYGLNELSWLREQVSSFVADVGNFQATGSKL